MPPDGLSRPNSDPKKDGKVLDSAPRLNPVNLHGIMSAVHRSRPNFEKGGNKTPVPPNFIATSSSSAVSPRAKRLKSPIRSPSRLIKMASSARLSSNPIKLTEAEETQQKLEAFVKSARNVPALRFLPTNVLLPFLQQVKEEVYSAGEIVATQGHRADCMYIIKKGNFMVKVVGADLSEPDVVRTLGVGEYFGELALLSESPRNASVISVDQTGACYVVQKAGFEELFQKDEVILGRKALESAKILENHPIFADATALILKNIREIMRPAIFHQREIIAAKQTQKNAMFCVTEGIIRMGNAHTFIKGDILGIECLGDGEPETWNEKVVVHSQRAKCMYVSKEDFISYVGTSVHKNIKQKLLRLRQGSIDSSGFHENNKHEEFASRYHTVSTVSEGSCHLLEHLHKYHDLFEALFYFVHANPQFTPLFKAVMWMKRERAIKQIAYQIKHILKAAASDRKENQLKLLMLVFGSSTLAYNLLTNASRVHLFKHLTYRKVDIDSNHVYDQGEPINDGNAYFLLSGKIEERDESNDIVRLFSAGEMFGTLALSTAAKRSFSAVCIEAAEMICVCRTAYTACSTLSTHQNNRSKEIEGFQHFLSAKVSCFQIACSSQVLSVICSTITRHTFLAGHAILRKGDNAHALYIIEEGIVSVSREITNIHSIASNYSAHISELGPGQFIGVSCFKDRRFSRGVPVPCEEDDYFAKSKVNVLVMPRYIVSHFPHRLVEAFCNIVEDQRKFRNKILSNATLCRRFDLIRTMSETATLRAVTKEILEDLEKHHFRPRSPRHLRDKAESHLRQHKISHVPSSSEELLRLRKYLAMDVIHTRPVGTHAKDLSGSFMKTTNGFSIGRSKIAGSQSTEVEIEDAEDHQRVQADIERAKKMKCMAEYSSVSENLNKPETHDDRSGKQMWKVHCDIGLPTRTKQSGMTLNPVRTTEEYKIYGGMKFRGLYNWN